MWNGKNRINAAFRKLDVPNNAISLGSETNDIIFVIETNVIKEWKQHEGYENQSK